MLPGHALSLVWGMPWRRGARVVFMSAPMMLIAAGGWLPAAGRW
jgi:hypothetical protein